MRVNNVNIFMVIVLLAAGLWFSNGLSVVHSTYTQPCVASIETAPSIVQNGGQRIYTLPSMSQISSGAREVYGVLTGSVPVEKYFNVNDIMNSMVY